MSFNKAKLFPLLSVFCIKNINQQARGKHGSQCSMKRAAPAVAQLRKIRVKMLRLFKEVEQTMESGDCSSASDEPSLKGWKLKRQSLRLDSKKKSLSVLLAFPFVVGYLIIFRITENILRCFVAVCQSAALEKKWKEEKIYEKYFVHVWRNFLSTFSASTHGWGIARRFFSSFFSWR